MDTLPNLPPSCSSRQLRIQQNLISSKNYVPLSTSWFHPSIKSIQSKEQNKRRDEIPESSTERSTDLGRKFEEEEAKINEMMREEKMEVERLMSMIQYEYINKNYIHSILLSHHFISSSSSPDDDQDNSTTTTKKIPFFLESCLISFKSLFLLISQLVPDTTLYDLPAFHILSKSLNSSLSFCSSAPSLGVISAYFLIKLDRTNEAIAAITPALIHTGDERIRALVKEILTTSKSPKFSAELLIQTILNGVSQNHARLNSIVTHHLGLNPNRPSSSVLETTSTPWACLIEALLESNQLAGIVDDLKHSSID